MNDIGYLLTLQSKLLDEFGSSPDLFSEIASMEGLLAETYRDRFLYELLQNSDDAGSTSINIAVQLNGNVSWENNGRPLSHADIEAISRSAKSTKSRTDSSIGYRGIGFKSLAGVAKSIDVESNGIQFRYDRSESARLIESRYPNVRSPTAPLIRIPTRIDVSKRVRGVAFSIAPSKPLEVSSNWIDPISIIFLRNVEALEFVAPGRPVIKWAAKRTPTSITLSRTGYEEAKFDLRRLGRAELAIPSNSAALTMVGVHGRLSCFLPLGDRLGLPVIVSGPILTDPSRTHAVTDAPETMDVLSDAAKLLTDLLNEPSDALFQTVWDLLLTAEDPRSILSSTSSSAENVFWNFVQRNAKSTNWKFAYSPIHYLAQEVDKVMPTATPKAIYVVENRRASRAVKAVLSLPTSKLDEQLTPQILKSLSVDTVNQIQHYLTDTAKALGRDLTPAERLLVPGHNSAKSTTISKPSGFTNSDTGRTRKFSDHMMRWQVAESSVRSHLIENGWDLEDVSTQNVGYDLSGTDATGAEVVIEVKKVDRMDARFTITNNEMSTLHAIDKPYWLAIVVGDGPSATLAMIDAKSSNLPFEKVCRRWDWECMDWSSKIARLDATPPRG